MTSAEKGEGASIAEVGFDVLQASDVDSMIRLIADAFSSREPPAVAMELSAQDMSQFLRVIAPAAASAGLTTVARLRSTGEVVGAMLSDDFAMPPASGLEAISLKFRPIFAMLQELDQKYLSGKTVRQGRYAHLLMLAVDSRFAGRGIAQGVIRCCLENAQRKGYQQAVTEATGKVSQHLFRKLGFRERFRLSYGDFQYERKAVFSSIAGQGGVALMDCALW